MHICPLGALFPMLWERQVYLPRLNKACHNRVRRLESLHESCYETFESSANLTGTKSYRQKARRAAWDVSPDGASQPVIVVILCDTAYRPPIDRRRRLASRILLTDSVVK
jgi:hypothetical protein